MAAWLAENAVTILTVTVVLFLLGVAVFSLIKDKKKKGGCTGNCATCGMGCSYEKKKS